MKKPSNDRRRTAQVRRQIVIATSSVTALTTHKRMGLAFGSVRRADIDLRRQPTAICTCRSGTTVDDPAQPGSGRNERSTRDLGREQVTVGIAARRHRRSRTGSWRSHGSSVRRSVRTTSARAPASTVTCGYSPFAISASTPGSSTRVCVVDHDRGPHRRVDTTSESTGVRRPNRSIRNGNASPRPHRSPTPTTSRVSVVDTPVRGPPTTRAWSPSTRSSTAGPESAPSIPTEPSRRATPTAVPDGCVDLLDPDQVGQRCDRLGPTRRLQSPRAGSAASPAAPCATCASRPDPRIRSRPGLSAAAGHGTQARGCERHRDRRGGTAIGAPRAPS